MQGGTIAPSLLKLRISDIGNITVMTRKKMKIDPSLFTCPFSEQKIPPDEGARCVAGVNRQNLVTPWAYTAPPSPSTASPGALLKLELCLHQGGGFYSKVPQGCGCQDCCLPGEWTPDSPHALQMPIPWLLKSLQSNTNSEQPPSFLLSQGTQRASKTEPGRAHPKVNKPGCHWFLTLSLAKGSKRSILYGSSFPLCKWEHSKLPKILQLIRAGELLTHFVIVISCSLFPVEHNHTAQSPVAASRWNEASRWEGTEHLWKKKIPPAENTLVLLFSLLSHPLYSFPSSPCRCLGLLQMWCE